MSITDDQFTLKFGEFDVTSIPYDWSKLPTCKAHDFNRKMEKTREEQIKQLERRVKTLSKDVDKLKDDLDYE